MKTVFAPAFILILFIVSCNGLKPDEDTTVGTIDNVFFQRSKNRKLPTQKRLAAVDSFLIESHAIADTSYILKGLAQKSYLLGRDKRYKEAIYFSDELLRIATVAFDKE